MTRPAVFGLGAAVGALLVWLGVLQWSSVKRAEYQHWRDSTQLAHAADSTRLAQRAQHFDRAAQVAREQRDAAIDRAAGLAQQAGQWARQIAVVRSGLDSARSAADSVPVLVAVVEGLDSLVVDLGAEVSSVREALAAELRHSAAMTARLAVADSATGVAYQRVAALDSVLRTRVPPPVPRGNWLGFIPKPRCGGGVALTSDLQVRPGLACVIGL